MDGCDTSFFEKLEHDNVFFFNVQINDAALREKIAAKSYRSIDIQNLVNLKRSETLICVHEYDTNKHSRSFIDNGFTNIIDIYWPYQDIHYKSRYGVNAIQDVFDEIIDAGRLMADANSIDIYFNTLMYRITYNNSLLLHISNFDEYIYPCSKSKSINCIIDGGAFDGDSIMTFMDNFSSDTYIYAFEPEYKNFCKLQQNLIGKPFNGEMINMALWNKHEVLDFKEDGDGSMVLHDDVSNKTVCVNGIDIDSFMREKMQVPNMIKMDIEGAEIQALHGGSDLISKMKPYLAISCYHNGHDLWQIPVLINNFNSRYTFALGHHNPRHSAKGTVLYAM